MKNVQMRNKINDTVNFPWNTFIQINGMHFKFNVFFFFLAYSEGKQ